MKYFLDTNICVYFLKGQNEILKRTIFSVRPSDIKIPSITKAELLYGAEKSQKRDENISRIYRFLIPYEIVGFNSEESEEYSRIRADLEKKGQIIGPNDILIAAIVKANNGTLVTHNTKEFSRVEGLRLLDWSL